MKGQSFDAAACYARAVEADDKNSQFWVCLGAFGGGVVKGVHFDQAACWRKAAER